VHQALAVHALWLPSLSSVFMRAIGQTEKAREFAFRTQGTTGTIFEREYTFVTEHKTGTTFLASITRNCLVPPTVSPSDSLPYMQWFSMTETSRCEHFDNFTMYPEWGRTVYMVRNPYEVIRSDYLYSMDVRKSGGEPVLHESAGNMFVGRYPPLREKTLPNETFGAYIHRVDMADGILAQMAGPSTRALHKMEWNYEKNRGLDRVLLVCLGDVFRAFDKTVHLILQHIGVAASTKLWGCLKLLDPSRRTFPHSTHDEGAERRQEVMRLIKQYDAMHFRGQFGGSPIALLCRQEGLT